METNDCYSLSGYLSVKPIGGKLDIFNPSSVALNLLVSTRRYWCALNENALTLDLFHSERDQLSEKKKPIERIFIRRSAISLSTNEERAFIILFVS